MSFFTHCNEMINDLDSFGLILAHWTRFFFSLHAFLFQFYLAKRFFGKQINSLCELIMGV